MTLIESGSAQLAAAAFRDDPHAAKYVRVLDAHANAFERLLDLLNDPSAVPLLEHESARGNAALRGIVGRIEADDTLAAAATDKIDGPRFRQAIGVAIRLKMALLGWSTSGRKGPVGGKVFTRAEKYVRPASLPSEGTSSSALAALDRVAAIGSDEERRSTGTRLDAALRATRSEQGRPF